MKEYILTREEIKRYEDNAMNVLGLKQEVLMERAAVAILNYILEQFPNKNRNIIVVCGMGNNGADGIATARLLKEYGYNSFIYLCGDQTKCSEVYKNQLNIASYYAIPIVDNLNDEYDIIIDAIFGFGLNRPIEGDIAEVINKLNSKRGYKISIDIPSGIECDTGNVLGTAFNADTTVTFGFYKRGHYLRDGLVHSGTIVKRNIGINEYCFMDRKPEMFMYIYDDSHTSRIDIGRNEMGNKGSFGKVLIIAGREDMSGACVLAAKSALRSGCGMVAVLTEESNRTILISALPECIVYSYKDESEIDTVFAQAEKWADVIAVGPGIGVDNIGLKLTKLSIFNSNKPLIVDADAINILARNKRLKIQLLDRLGNSDTHRTLIFTPHIKEFARLSEKPMEKIISDKAGVCQFFSRQFHCVLALKDAYTVVCENDNIYINIISNDAMATAGSGDVLTGLMASIISQYIKRDNILEHPNATKEDFPFFGAVMSVFIHSRAGLKAAEMNGRSYMIASDVIEKFGEVLI